MVDACRQARIAAAAQKFGLACIDTLAFGLEAAFGDDTTFRGQSYTTIRLFNCQRKAKLCDEFYVAKVENADHCPPYRGVRTEMSSDEL